MVAKTLVLNISFITKMPTGIPITKERIDFKRIGCIVNDILYLDLNIIIFQVIVHKNYFDLFLGRI